MIPRENSKLGPNKEYKTNVERDALVYEELSQRGTFEKLLTPIHSTSQPQITRLKSACFCSVETGPRTETCQEVLNAQCLSTLSQSIIFS